MVQVEHEMNPKDIPRQEEFSSVFQRCKALADTQIELFGHLEGVTSTQGYDSRLVRTALVIVDMQTRWPLCGSLHQQAV